MDRGNEIHRLVTNIDFFTQSFWVSVNNKLLNTGYIEIDIFFKHYSISERNSLLSALECPQLTSLLQKSQINEDALIDILNKIQELSLPEDILALITAKMGKVIISWLLYSCKQRYAGIIRNELAKWVSRNKADVIYTDSKYLIRKDIDYKIINDLSTYINIILELIPKNHIFFRGQESLNYWIQPSINRTPALYQNESKLYQELILRCPDDFSRCKSHLDYLVEMQHYGLPTRLIDITSNPLVALYFSSLGKSDSGSGEVIIFDIPNNTLKYERSDTVSILSCLPLFSYNDQVTLYSDSYMTDQNEFNHNETVLQLLQEIKIDNPAFSDRIVPSDLRKNLVVTPSLKNNRIVKQAGAFIISGLVDHSGDKSNPLELLRYCSSKGQQLLIIIESKEKIQKELCSFNINSATLFPEIDDVASYLKSSWL